MLTEKGKITSLSEIMTQVKLWELRNLIHSGIKLASQIDSKSDYYMPEIVILRQYFERVIPLCGSGGDYHLPRTKSAAEDVWCRNFWNIMNSVWKKEGRDWEKNRPIFPGNPKFDIPDRQATNAYPEPVRGDVLIAEWQQLREAFERDLQEIIVFELDEEESDFYRNIGYYAIAPNSLRRFPVGEDIQAAGRCFAAGEYTACVFHLGRTTECVLKNLAQRRKIEFYGRDAKTKKLDKKNPKSWGKLEDEIRKRAHGIKNDSIKTAYSDAVAASRKLRRLRNNVDHASILGSKIYETKDRDEVKSIWSATKDFIEFAAQTFPIRKQAKS
jgi:hypothetical protein